ncbi:hypothetical protein ASSaV_gp27 [Abalone shriveling syndrome-associated virus]|uniref:hypothetical protein n=1 Tax=Abalone shriveling syndrome-associated virus TaxID=491893 RepID=UPI0001881BA9|nr:hypothetical protein ASSaV_gp27 [Abalone shriveling syndrome-associated virus]ACJ71978.1 unknown [Abalone shriveling syndrome-associated virus]
MFFPIVRDIAIDSFQWSFVPYLLFYSNAREFDKYRQAGSITYYDVKDEDYQRLKMRSIPYCGGRFLLGSEEETKLFPSYFTNVLIFGLASRLASSQGSFTTSRFMDTKYKEALAEARVIDADDPCDIDDCYWRPYPHKNNRGYCRDRIC